MVDQQFVSVPVPARLVPDVFQFVLDKTRAGSTPELASEAPSEWSAAELALFFSASSKNPRAIMECLAARPGESLTTADFAGAIGKRRDDPRGTWSVAGVLGAIQKSAKRNFGRDWPFECAYSSDGETYYYSMPERYASVIAAEAARLRTAL